GQDHDLPPAARRGVRARPEGARAGDPGHRPPRAGALLRDRRGPPGGARLRLGNRPAESFVVPVMRTLTEIRQEIDRLPDRRADVLHALSDGYDAELASEHKELEELLAELWEEQRAARATIRHGDRDVIIQRARQEERLSRAA